MMSQRADPAAIELLSRPGQSISPEPLKLIEHDSAALPERSQRLKRWKWDSLIVDILSVLLVIPFLVLIIFCASKDQKPVEAKELNRMNQGLWISATAFTLVFSALVSRMTRRMAEWRLERGSSLKVLESLNGSTTLINTVTTQLQLQSFGILSITLVLLWTVSPVGSQSPLHILSTAQTIEYAPQVLQQVPINSSSVVGGADDMQTYAPFINSIYTTSLLAAGSYRHSSMDAWKNVKIPDFNALKSPANSTGWKPAPTGQNITYAALNGMPIGGLNRTGNITAVIQSTYFSLNLLNSTGDLNLNGNGLAVNLTGSDYFIPWNQSDSKTFNATTDTETAIVTFSPVNGSFTANYSWKQNYYESEIMCVIQGPLVSQRDCYVQAIRPLRASTPPEFGFVTVNNLQHEWNSLLSGQNFSLSGAYLRYPASPLEANLSDSSTASPSADDLQTRLQQLLNTFWFGTIDPVGSVVGTPSKAIELNGIRATLSPRSIYVIDFVWLGVYLVATIILAASTVLTAVLTAISMNPDILGYLSTFIWHSPCLHMTQSGTFRGGDEKTRSIKSFKLRLGDVQPGKDVGQLSVGRIHDVTEVKARRYFL